nr:ribonuclease H-like domain-containing protein [Tanacetum cinerariifolium]
MMHRYAERFTNRRDEINNIMVLQDHPLVDYGSSGPLGRFSDLQLILPVMGLLIAAATHLYLFTDREFSMTDLGSFNYFLGISITRDSSRMFLSQRKYAAEILERAHMVNCNPSRNPVDTESKLGDDSDPISNPTLYRSLASSLQYFTFTRPIISYAVQQDMHDPRSLISRLLNEFCEYRGVANAVAETCWLRNLLCELYTPLSSATLVYCNNVSAIYLSANPVQHQRTKHIEIYIHFIRDLITAHQ